MEKYEFEFFSLHSNDALDAINRAGSKGFQFAGMASDVVILTRKVKAKRGHAPKSRPGASRSQRPR